MTNTIRPRRSGVTGAVPAVDPTKPGEMFINFLDRKIYQRDGAGVIVPVADRITDYSNAKNYALGDYSIFDDGGGQQLYRCNTAITTPEAFDPAKWTLLGGGGGGPLTDAVIINPTTPGRNTIDVAGNPTVEGLLITGDQLQSEPLLKVSGTAADDPGEWAINELGFPNPRAGAASFRAAAGAHPFTSVGQAAHYVDNATGWVLAQEPAQPPHALVQETLGVNAVDLRQAGELIDLDTASFAGGVITAGEYYYCSDTVAGQLTTTQSPGAAPVLFTVSPTSGLVLGAGAVGGTSVTIGDAFPTAPNEADLHYLTIQTVGLYIFYNDGTSSQWVQTNGSAPGTAITTTDYTTVAGQDTFAKPIAGTNNAQVFLNGALLAAADYTDNGADIALATSVVSDTDVVTVWSVGLASSVDLTPYVRKAGDTMTGSLSFDGGGGTAANINPTTGTVSVAGGVGTAPGFVLNNAPSTYTGPLLFLGYTDARRVVVTRTAGQDGPSVSVFDDALSTPMVSIRENFHKGMLTLSNDGNGATPTVWEVVTTGRGSGSALNMVADAVNVGNFNATTGVYTATSDERLKDNIRPVETGMDEIMALEPITYEMGGEKRDGFSAQSVEQISEHWVSPPSDGKPVYHMNYADIVPALVKAVQELKAEVDSLKGVSK